MWDLSPQRTAFSSLAYLTAAARAYSLRARMHLVSREGIDEAGVIVLWRRCVALKQVVQAPFTQYSALLAREPPSEALVHCRRDPLDALLQSLERSYARVQLLAHVDDPRPAQWRRWRVSPLFTYCLDPGAGVADWSASAARTFRKHRASFEIEESPRVAADIVSLCRDSYRRHGRRLPARPARLLSLIASLGDCVRCFAARRHGATSPEAGLAVLHDGATAHYWVAGSLPGPSMTVLIGHVLPLLHTGGITTFDFTGANTASVAEFKRRFGPVLTPYCTLTWHR